MSYKSAKQRCGTLHKCKEATNLIHNAALLIGK